jgi:cob(I)alamin adenosyltransferase
MVRINKIYTRSGDTGKTHLIGGVEVEKNHFRVAAYGDIDELNAAIGLAAALAKQHNVTLIASALESLQQRLFDFGAEIATPPDASYPCPVPTTDNHITWLETEIDRITEVLPALKSFVLPGGHILTAQLHVARTVCRRAERSLLTLHAIEPIPAQTIQYSNRLSDYLFALARFASHCTETPEVLWDSRRTQN